MTGLEYTMHPARYAKDKMALQIPGVDGWKSPAACILTFDIAPNCLWSRREGAYIVSKNQCKRFVAAVEAVKISRQQEKPNDFTHSFDSSSGDRPGDNRC